MKSSSGICGYYSPPIKIMKFLTWIPGLCDQLPGILSHLWEWRGTLHKGHPSVRSAFDVHYVKWFVGNVCIQMSVIQDRSETACRLGKQEINVKFLHSVMWRNNWNCIHMHMYFHCQKIYLRMRSFALMRPLKWGGMEQRWSKQPSLSLLLLKMSQRAYWQMWVSL